MMLFSASYNQFLIRNNFYNPYIKNYYNSSMSKTMVLTIPSQTRYSDQALSNISGSLTLYVDSQSVRIVSNNISILTSYIQNTAADTRYTPTVNVN